MKQIIISLYAAYILQLMQQIGHTISIQCYNAHVHKTHHITVIDITVKMTHFKTINESF